jgi:hypothetical protein
LGLKGLVVVVEIHFISDSENFVGHNINCANYFRDENRESVWQDKKTNLIVPEYIWLCRHDTD